MNKPVKVFLFCLSFIVLLTNCEDNLDYYDRPESLPPPMYQQLDSMGNFTNFLALAEKAGYARTLKGSGYWTLFAPTDEAFKEWFAQEGLSSIEDVDEDRARAIVTYALVYNAFTVERLSDYQSNLGWEEDVAFKRKTAYYDGVYTARNVEMDGEMVPEVLLIANNRPGASLFVDDNSQKYIPYFTQEYFEKHALSEFDYNYFYPNTEWVQFNVAGAKVEKANLFAENGYIHVIDKVIEPLPNVEQHLAKKEEYSLFRDILEKHLVTYDMNSPEAAQVTSRYAPVLENPGPVAIKSYYTDLLFAPNTEDWIEPELKSWIANETQANGNSIFVPSNQALDNYISNYLLQFYPDKDNIGQLPAEVLSDFVTAHMWSRPVWPSKFEVTLNEFGDPARFDQESEVIEKKVLSNAFFYGTNKVLESNLFHSVFGRAYLDPKYSMMVRYLGEAAKKRYTQPEIKHTMFLISDEALTAAGYSYNEETVSWVYTPPEGGRALTGSDASSRLKRVIGQHVVFATDEEYLLNNLSDSGIVKTINGEFIKFGNKTVYSAGNLDRGEVANIVEGPIYARNGIVYLLDKILEVSDSTIAGHLKINFGESHFWKYLENSSIYENDAIKGTTAGAPYTVLVPTNAAIEQAIRDGVLPGKENEDGTVTPDFTGGDAAGKAIVASFIQYHIIANTVLAADAVGDDISDSGYTTVYKNLDGQVGVVWASDGDEGAGPLTFQGMNGNSAEIVEGENNILSNWAVIHQINNYLYFNE